MAVHEFEEFTGGAVVGDLGRGWVSVFIIIFYYYYHFLFLRISFLFFFIPFIFTVFCNFLLHRHKQREMKTYWIWSRSEAVKGIFTLCSGIKLSTKVVIVLRIILLLVESYNTISLSADVDGKKKRMKKRREKCCDVPLVLACQTSIEAFGIGLPVLASVTVPWT